MAQKPAVMPDMSKKPNRELKHLLRPWCHDPTEVVINRIVDRDGKPRFICTYPTKWHEVEYHIEPGGVLGHNQQIFEVDEWEEVELEVKA